MLLVPPTSHPHSSSHTGPTSCVDQANNHSSGSSSPGHSNPDSPAIVIKQQPVSPPPSPTNSTDLTVASAVPNGQPHPHMSGLSEAHYPPVSQAAASQPAVTGRSPQAPPAPLSAPGTPAPTTPTPAPVTTRPSSGGSASGGSAPPVTSNSLSSVSVAGGLSSAAGGGSTVTTGSGGTGGNSTSAGTGGLPPAMPVPGPSVTPSGGSSAGQLPQHHPLLGYVPHGANKILSRNINGTRESGGSVGDKKNAMVTVTSNPSNESELQLYRVLQRANLLNYYDTFISQGGDDVQQLCEAGEEEFLEIMALVGMASKPLHVRRLQKALQEWVSNPDSARTMIPAEAMKQRELYTSVPSNPATTWGSSMPNNPRPTAPYHNQNEGLFLMPIKSPAPAPTSGMPPQLDAFNLLSSLTTSYRQHHQQPQSSNITQSPRGTRIPPVAAAAAAAVAAATPHTAPYQRPQPYPSPENLTARKSPPTGGVAPQPGSVSPTDYRRVLEAAWALRAAGQQDPRSSPPGGKISPPGGAMNNRSTWPSTMSPPSSSNRSPGHHTDSLHNNSESQPFLPGTPVPWFPFLVPVNKL